MVRIINRPENKRTEQDQAEIKLPEKSKALLQIIGIAIAENPKAIIDLLEDFGVRISEDPTDKELTESLLSAVCENNSEFNGDLAKIILNCGLANACENFGLAERQQNDSYSEEGGGGGNGNAMMGIVGGLTDSISNVANVIGARRAAKEQATSNTLQGIYNYRTQIAASQQSKSKTKMYVLIGLFLLLGIAFISLIAYMNKQDQKQQPIPIKA